MDVRGLGSGDSTLELRDIAEDFNLSAKWLVARQRHAEGLIRPFLLDDVQRLAIRALAHSSRLAYEKLQKLTLTIYVYACHTRTYMTCPAIRTLVAGEH